MNNLKKAPMNKHIKLDWDTVQRCITQSEDWEAFTHWRNKIKKIKTFAKFIKHKDAPYWLFCYAQHLNIGRIEAFEELISKDVISSYYYCLYVAKCRIKAFEKTIATSAKYSFRYCVFVAERRIKALEAIIATDSEYSFLYCKYVVCHRLRALEKAISTNAYYSFVYCRDVARYMVPKFKNFIKKDKRLLKEYLALPTKVDDKVHTVLYSLNEKLS